MERHSLTGNSPLPSLLMGISMQETMVKEIVEEEAHQKDDVKA